MFNKLKHNMNNDTVSVYRIDVIDGIRVLAIALIAWFHIWQQSWLMPYLKITSDFGIDFSALPRAGYIWVDMFIMLSAFQLFLPHAREVLLGDKKPGIKEFYKKRARRILPSYLLAIIICLYFAIFSEAYSSLYAMLVDLLSHLTFTHTLWKRSYLWTNLNSVLWTVGVLVHFYILFPFLAIAFKKKPALTFFVMSVLGIVFRMLFVNNVESPAMYVNQMPAFLDVFAIGMMGAYIFVLMNKKMNYQKFSPLFTLISLLSLAAIYYAMYDLATLSGSENIQNWQGKNRTWVTICFMTFLLSSAYSMKWYRKIYSNKVAVFLSSISFNFYIWHQYIAVKFRAWNFPYSEYEYPNMFGELEWQWKYTIACFLSAIIFAWLVTWLYEGKLIKKVLSRTQIKKEN